MEAEGGHVFVQSQGVSARRHKKDERTGQRDFKDSSETFDSRYDSSLTFYE